jgi:hypothetical protein
MVKYDIISADSMIALIAAVDTYLAANPSWYAEGKPFYSAALKYSQAVYA